MASGDGVCATEAQIENRSMLAMINRRLDMGSSDDRSRDDTRKLSFPTQQQEASTSREIDVAFATFVRERPSSSAATTIRQPACPIGPSEDAPRQFPRSMHSVSIPKPAA
jgi:hypothetical protein